MRLARRFRTGSPCRLGAADGQAYREGLCTQVVRSDTAVVTFVLCSDLDEKAALGEITRVLVAGMIWQA